MRRSPGVIALSFISGVTAVAISITGCSGSSPTTSTPSGSSSSAQPSNDASGVPAPTFTGSNAAFCNAMSTAGEALVALNKTLSGSDPTATQAAQEQLTSAIQQVRNALPSNAPAKVESALAVFEASIKLMVKTSSPDPAKVREASQANQTIGEYAQATCPTQ